MSLQKFLTSVCASSLRSVVSDLKIEFDYSLVLNDSDTDAVKAAFALYAEK